MDLYINKIESMVTNVKIVSNMAFVCEISPQIVDIAEMLCM